MTGFFATATSALEPGTVAADTETYSEKRKPRFQANAAEVQTFYRVNRTRSLRMRSSHADEAIGT